MGETLYSRKKKKVLKLKQTYFEDSENKGIGIIKLTNKENLDLIINSLEILPTNFLILDNDLSDEFKEKTLNISNIKLIDEIIEDEILGFDFLLTDSECEQISKFMEFGVCPIIPHGNHLGQLLKEFDPMENVGNSFLYLDNNIWSANYALIRYLENSKFPMDNRNLIKNISSL